MLFMKILKFGGSSVGSTESLKIVKEIINDCIENNTKIIVVCSAFYSMTNLLQTIGNLSAINNNQYINELNNFKLYNTSILNSLNTNNKPEIITTINNLYHELEKLIHHIFIQRNMDYKDKNKLLAFGEIISCNIIAFFLNENNILAKYVDASKLIKTKFYNETEEVDFDKSNLLINEFFSSYNYIPIVTGFIACDENEHITTLGRGGSDYTASIIGAALNSEVIEIWTDVNGIMSVDPKFLPSSFSIEKVSYEDAIIFSKLGGKVIYTPTIYPAFRNGIPILIKNTFNKNHPGTFITHKNSNEKKSNLISILDNIFMICIENGSQKFDDIENVNAFFKSLKINPILFYIDNQDFYFIFNFSEINLECEIIVNRLINYFNDKEFKLSSKNQISLISITSICDMNQLLNKVHSNNLIVLNYKTFELHTVIFVDKNNLTEFITILHNNFIHS